MIASIPILLYGSEIWTLKMTKRLASIERKFFRRTALSDHKRNEETLEQTKVETADEKLQRYKSNWLRHVTRRRCKNNAELQTK
jgi:hypothetical protein